MRHGLCCLLGCYAAQTLLLTWVLCGMVFAAYLHITGSARVGAGRRGSACYRHGRCCVHPLVALKACYAPRAMFSFG